MPQQKNSNPSSSSSQNQSQPRTSATSPTQQRPSSRPSAPTLESRGSQQGKSKSVEVRDLSPRKDPQGGASPHNPKRQDY